MMFNNRTLRILVVLLLAAIVMVAYFAVAGVNKALPDIGEDTDPTGAEREPIKYGVFTIKVGVKNEYNRFDGKFYEIICDIYDYVPGEAQFYTSKWDILGIFDDDVTIIVTAYITGPSNYLSDMVTYSLEDNIPEIKIEYNHYDFGPYKAYFWDAGEYKIHSTLSVESDEFTGTIATYSQAFNVPL